MKPHELKTILRQHLLWLKRRESKYAKYAHLDHLNLSNMNFYNVNLSEANLKFSNLSKNDFSNSDFSHADLSYADLNNSLFRGANFHNTNLSGVKGLIDLSDLGLEHDEKGIIVYKSFNEDYEPSPCWKIEKGSIIHEIANSNRTNLCGCGINVVTLEWCKSNCDNQIWKCRIPFICEYEGKTVFPTATIVLPYNSDGKFRCEYLELIKPID